jgi:heme o synthase
MYKKSSRQLWALAVKTGIIKSNLVPMLAGLMLALYTYNLSFVSHIVDLVLAILGTAAVIASAGTFNNIYDRDIDKIMPRTQKRPSVTGEISVKSLMIAAIVLLIAGVVMLYFTTPLAALLGFLGVFLYVVPYTIWTKRKTIWNTEVGSLSGAMPPLIGWAAVAPDIWHPACWALFAIMVIWQMPHFYAIAIRKQDDYAAAHIPMLPVVKGERRTYIQTNIYLILLMISSALFYPLSLGLTLVALILSAVWLAMSIIGYHKKEGKKWANKMFVFSLVHMVVIFSTVILYSILGLILRVI